MQNVRCVNGKIVFRRTSVSNVKKRNKFLLTQKIGIHSNKKINKMRLDGMDILRKVEAEAIFHCYFSINVSIFC